MLLRRCLAGVWTSGAGPGFVLSFLRNVKQANRMSGRSFFKIKQLTHISFLKTNTYDAAFFAKIVNYASSRSLFSQKVSIVDRLGFKYASDSIHPSSLLLRESNTKLPVLLKARIIRYPRCNMKNRLTLFFPFSINSKSFAPALH